MELIGSHAGRFRFGEGACCDHPILLEIEAQIDPTEVAAILPMGLRTFVERVVVDLRSARGASPRHLRKEATMSLMPVSRLSGMALQE